MVSKLDWQTSKSEFESHWVPHSYGLVQHLSKTLSKLLPIVNRHMIKKAPACKEDEKNCELWLV